MDEFFTQEEDTQTAYDVDGLVDALIERLGVNAFFAFTYKAAINTALIFGEANLIGQYIEENFIIKLNLAENIAELFHEEELLETYSLNADAFTAYLTLLRENIGSENVEGHTPESLATALVESIWGEDDVIFNVIEKDHLVQPYISCVLVAAVNGDCRVASKKHTRLDLVIHPERPLATLCQDDEIIDSFKLDADAFAELREKYAALNPPAEGEEE